MVAHVWAAGTQDEGRNARENVWFRGDTIYSYGSHFPMARRVKGRSGASAFLMTTRTYSNTTAKHLREVSSALRNHTVFHVRDVTDKTHAVHLAEYEERIAELALTASRARANAQMY